MVCLTHNRPPRCRRGHPLNRCLLVVERLLQHEDAEPFSQPVRVSGQLLIVSACLLVALFICLEQLASNMLCGARMCCTSEHPIRRQRCR